MVILDEVLAVSGCVAVCDAREVYIGINIGSDQLEEVFVAAAASFIAGGTQRTGSFSVAPHRLKNKIHYVEEGIHERTSNNGSEVELQ